MPCLQLFTRGWGWQTSRLWEDVNTNPERACAEQTLVPVRLADTCTMLSIQRLNRLPSCSAKPFGMSKWPWRSGCERTNYIPHTSPPPPTPQKWDTRKRGKLNDIPKASYLVTRTHAGWDRNDRFAWEPIGITVTKQCVCMCVLCRSVLAWHRNLKGPVTVALGPVFSTLTMSGTQASQLCPALGKYARHSNYVRRQIHNILASTIYIAGMPDWRHIYKVSLIPHTIITKVSGLDTWYSIISVFINMF